MPDNNRETAERVLLEFSCARCGQEIIATESNVRVLARISRGRMTIEVSCSNPKCNMSEIDISDKLSQVTVSQLILERKR